MSDRSTGKRILGSLRFTKPLRSRDFRLLWSGVTLSLVGDGVFFLTLAWQVYELSSSPATLALAGLIMEVPLVSFLLVGGVVSDRFQRRRVLIASDILRALPVGALGFFSLGGDIHVWHVFLSVAIYGVGEALFWPSFMAIVPDLVPPDDLVEANSLNIFSRFLGLAVLGPLLGGAVIAAWGTGQAFLIDAVTFVFSICAVFAISERRAVSWVRTEAGPNAIVEGLSYVRSRRWLWSTMVAAALVVFLTTGPVRVLVPLIVKEKLGASAEVLGLVFTGRGVGGLLGSIVMGQKGASIRNSLPFVYVSWTVGVVAIAAYGALATAWTLLIPAFVTGFTFTTGTVAWNSLIQKRVDRHVLGRVSSLDTFAETAPVPLSYALTGPVAAGTGAVTTLVMSGLIGGAAVLSMFAVANTKTRIQEASTDPLGGMPDPEVGGETHIEPSE